MAEYKPTETSRPTDEASTRTMEISDFIEQIGPKHCRIITDVGEFTHIITVKLDDPINLTLKFQLSASYPETLPEIVVLSTQLNEESQADLMEKLTLRGHKLQGQPMLTKLVQEAKDYMTCLMESESVAGAMACRPKEQRKTGRHQKGDTKNKQKKGNRKKSKAKDGEVENEKLASMKTAEDVISRILWDDNLQQEDFTIGYLDRFLGVVEKNFSAFSWEDLSSVDWTTLAIPKHRIQYFKYRSVVVWDKNTRLDNMYGSTGSGRTIQDVIAEYKEEQFADAVDSAPIGTPWVLSQGNEEEESDDEDNVQINLGDQDFDDSQDVPVVPEYKKDHYWGPKSRPTHFLCLRITDPQIRHNVKYAQEVLCGIEPGYEDAIIPPERLHVTLCCLGLDTDDRVDYAVDTIHRIKEDLAALNPKDVMISLNDVDNFFHNVLYAKVEKNHKLMDFVNHLKICLQEAGIELRDLFEFTPHMTLLKLKSAWGKEYHTRYIDARAYEELTRTYFGQQCLDNLYLCKMSEDREDGFYVCPTSISF